MSKKKITLDVSVLAQKKSGVPIYVENLVDELIKKNINLDLISSTELPKFSRKYQLKSFNNNFSYKRIFWENFFMGKEIKTKIYHNPLFLLPRFGLKKDIKTVITVHDLAFFEDPSSFDLRTRLYFKIFLPYSLKRANAIIAISKSTAKSLINHYPAYRNKIHVIYNGFNDYSKYLLSKNISLHDKPYFLQVGCGHPRKNLELSINSYLEYREVNNNVDLILVSTSNKQKKKYKKIPGIVFMDNLSDEELFNLYRNAISALYPSSYEGFGFPILEAMSAGCPIICSNIPSSKEISNYDKEDMFDLGDSEKLSMLMQKITENEIYRKKIIDYGFERIKEFSWKKMSDNVIKLYNLMDKS